MALRGALALFTGSVLFTGALLAQVSGFPPELDPPKDGDAKIKGKVRSAVLAVRIKIFAGDGTSQVTQCDVTAESTNGTFTLALSDCKGAPATLKQGSILAVSYISGGNEQLPALVSVSGNSAPATTAVADKPPGACEVKSIRADSLSAPGIEGAIAGSNMVSGDSVLISGKVHICVDGNQVPFAASGNAPKFGTDDIEFSSGRYSLQLQTPLEKGKQLVVVATSADGVRLVANENVTAGISDCDENKTSQLNVHATQGTMLTGPVGFSGGTVLVCLSGSPLSSALASSPSTFAKTALTFTGSTYNLVMQSPLLPNQHIVVVATSSDFKTRVTGSADVKAAVVSAISTAVSKTPTVGQTTILVMATPTPSNSTWEVRVSPCDPSLALKTKDGKPYVVTDVNGSATLPLDQPLAEDQSVSVCQSAFDKATGTALALQAGSKIPQILKGPIKKNTPVSVQADPTPTPSGAQVRVYPCNPKYQLVNDHHFETTSSLGVATLTFVEDVADGVSVGICESVADNAGNALTLGSALIPQETTLASSARHVLDPGDLGRFRFYFTSGVVLSSANNFQVSSGTQAGLFLGLTVDRSWLSGKGPGSNTPIGWRRWNIGTFLDARLTSVAVQAGAMTTSATSPTPLETFVSSAKAATLHGGVYVPFSLPPFQVGSRKSEMYSLFIGPLAKTGFTTLLDNSAGTTTTTTGTTSVTNFSGRFFTDFSYGGRLGLFRNRANKDSAPEIVTYLDVTVGRFGGFEAFRDARMDIGNAIYPFTDPLLHTIRPWRYEFEGQIKLPHTPFIVGFNANVGRGSVSSETDPKDPTRRYSFTQPHDDLRFLIGAQFDFGKLMKLIPQVQ
jgi:hypothetical protein